jgi:aminoglycoside phosphotransferase
VIRAVCDRLNALGPGSSPSLCSGLVVGIDQDPTVKVTLILFDESGRPGAVAKVARQAAAEQALQAEHDVLLDLQSSPLPTVSDELPRPLLLERIGGRAVLATTALPGAPLTVRYYHPGHVQDRDLVAEDFQLAGSWLSRFQRESRTGRVVSGAQAFDEWVRPTFARYRETIGWSGWEEQLLDRLTLIAHDLADVSIPLVAVHGDYAIGNILVDRGGVSGVVDWELGRRVGLPFPDLFKFTASYGSYLDRAAPPRHGVLPGHPGWAEARTRWGGLGTVDWTNAVNFLHAYFGRGWFPDLVRAFLLGHFRRLGVPLSASALFLPAFVAEQAMALENPVFRNGYRSLLSVLWQEGDARWLRRLEVAG